MGYETLPKVGRLDVRARPENVSWHERYSSTGPLMIGRNDPCPCGSGRKYKKCHGVSQQVPVATPDAARARALKARDVALGENLFRYARASYGPRWLHDTLEAEGLLDDDNNISDSEMPVIIPLLMHYCVNETGLTLAEEWHNQQQHRITPDDLLLLHAYDAAWVSFWEVADVEPGTGSRLIDVLTREERFVHDVRSSSTLERFDTILAIVLTCDGVSFFGGVHGQPLSPRFAQPVVQDARRMCRVRTRAVAPEVLRDPDMELLLIDRWIEGVEEMLHQPPPVLHNTDGDPLVMTRDDYALVAKHDDIARRLAGLQGVAGADKEGGATVFTVTKSGNAVHQSWENTVVARILLTQARLIVETNSARRADAMRSAVESHMQGLVRFRLRSEESTAQWVENARAGHAGEPSPREAIPAEMVAGLRQFREQHMRGWIDESIPALGGLTPRDAAQHPASRRKLETLLKEFDQSEARLPEEERIDLRWLREALGFEAPS